MDRSLYISYTVLLDKHILARIGTHFIFFDIFLTYITLMPIKFLALLPGTDKSLVLRQNAYQSSLRIGFDVEAVGGWLKTRGCWHQA